MVERVIAPVAPVMLVWARRTASVAIEDAAKAAGVPPERLAGWESGDEHPTLPQLRALATKYKRPLSVMLLPDPPRDFQPLRDFRRIDGRFEAQLPASVAFEIRQAQERREILLDLIRSGDEEATTFDLKCHVGDDIEGVAAMVRRFLGVTADAQRRAARTDKTFAYWRRLMEAKDVLVFVMGGSSAPKVREVRGFAIPAPTLPIVAVNGRDRGGGRAFTLLHEFVHVVLGEAVVENAVAPGPWLPAADRRIERFCNAVAAATLMPTDMLRDEVRGRDKSPDSDWTPAELEETAKRFGVSREAALIRLVDRGYASRRFYVHKRAAFDEEYERLDDKVASKTIVKHHLTMIGRYGGSYARRVISSYRDRRITMSDAAGYLGVQAKHIAAVERQAFQPT